MSVVNVHLSGSPAQMARALAAIGCADEATETPEQAVINFDTEFLIAELKDRLQYESPPRTLHVTARRVGRKPKGRKRS